MAAASGEICAAYNHDENYPREEGGGGGGAQCHMLCNAMYH